MSRRGGEVNELTLERFVAGELPPAQRAALEARLAQDATLAARVESLRRSNAEILRDYPVERMGHAIRAKAEASTSRRAPLWLLAGPVLAVAAFAVWLAPLEESDLEVARTKGAAKLSVYRQASGGIEKLTHGAAARAADLLQLAYIGGGEAHGVILSIDGRGGVTLHSPANASDSTALAHVGEVRLPRAYQLDDAPGFELFIFVTADGPIDVAALLDRARAHAARASLSSVPSLSPHGTQVHVGLRKVP